MLVLRKTGSRTCQQITGPMDLYCPFSSAWYCKLPIQDSTLTGKQSIVYPNDARPAAREELWKDTGSPQLLLEGYPPPAFFLRIASPTHQSTLRLAHLQGLGFAWGLAEQWKGEQVKIQKPCGVCSATFHCNLQPSTKTPSKPAFAQVNTEDMKKCCRLVALSHNNNLKNCAQGHLTFTRPAGLLRTPALEKCPWLLNLKWTQIWPDSQAEMFQGSVVLTRIFKNSTSNEKMLRICHD